MKKIISITVATVMCAVLMLSTFGVSAKAFTPLKTLSKFFIVLAMSAIGMNTDIVKLVKNGGKPILLGFCCWAGITAVSLVMQHAMHLW